MTKEIAKREYTEKQERFLNTLFSEECKGDIRAAMTLAGYDKHSNIHDVVDSLKEEIIARTNLYMATIGPNAAMALFDVLMKPEALGSSIKLNAAKEILDRIGVVKKEETKVHVEIQNIVELPTKTTETIVIDN